MVDLPSIPRRLVTTQAPDSRVSAQDVASPFRMLGDALDAAAPGVDALAEREGQKAGLEKSITTGEDGLPTVTMMPAMTGAYGAAYNRAATWAYTAKIANSIDEKVLAAKQEFAGNPAGFQAWAKGYAGDLIKREKDPTIRASVEKMVSGATSEAWRGIAADHQRTVIAGTKAAMKARREALDNRMAALANKGALDSPEYRQAMADYDAIGREASTNAALGVPAEAVAAERNSMIARHTAEAIIGGKVRRGGTINPDPTSVVERIVGAESGGNAAATNRASSATGAGQFIDSTWLSMVKRYRPDLAAGKSDAEVLNLRNDAAISREMTGRLAKENGDALTAAGHVASAGNVYLAHFLGPSGAIGVLESKPDTPVRDALIAGGMSAAQADAAIKANPTVLQGKTAGAVAGWARGKMGDGEDDASAIEDAIWSPDLDLSPEERRRFSAWAHQEVNRADADRKKASGIAAEAHERTIIDSAAGRRPPVERSVIENDPKLTEESRNTLLRQYDSAMGDIIKTNRAYDRFNAGADFNPFDTDDRKALDGIFKRLGGDGAALKTVVDKTGIAPPAVVKTLRGDLASTDPAKVGSGLQLAANLISANPTVFAGQDGGDDIAKSAATFRHYIDDLGYTADQASARMAADNTPEAKKAIAAKVKGEDVDELVRKNLDISDLRSAFDTSWLPGRPEVGFSPEGRGEMFADYAELFRHRFRETGDIATAKAQAVAQLKRVWGVTRINGSETVMRYPPEQAPGLGKLEDPASAIRAAALADLETGGFGKVDPASLKIAPIPGITAEAFKAGQKVPYTLAWTDANGVYHALPPGRGFLVDPEALAARQTAEREKAFKAAQSPQEPTIWRDPRPYRERGPLPAAIARTVDAWGDISPTDQQAARVARERFRQQKGP